MTESVELQIISKVLTCNDDDTIAKLLEFDSSYYAVFTKHIQFIQDHYSKYGDVPDTFTCLDRFPDLQLIDVSEPIEYLVTEIRKNKQTILLREAFNGLKDLGEADVTEAWDYLRNKCDEAEKLDECKPMNIISQAKERAATVVEFSKKARIPTGFPEIDKVMYGGLSTVEELCLILARTNSGKAQPLWSKVLTPSGWVKMGDIKIGDIVVGENNDNGKVVDIFPQGKVPYYRIYFNDNTFAECCGNHLWKVLDSNRRSRANSNYGKHLLLTTNDMLQDYKIKRYSVDISEPIEFVSEFDEANELDGYLLGLILGDGGLRDASVVLSNESEEIWSNIAPTLSKYNCKRSDKRKTHDSIVGCGSSNFVRDKLIEYGLMNTKSIDKFIPKQYLTAPVNVRKALLAGLVDTDGYHPKACTAVWEFDTASEQLAADFAELARSLGVIVKVHERKPTYYTVNGTRIPAHGSRHIVCRSKFNPFRYSVKASRFEYRDVVVDGRVPKRFAKTIERIEYAGETECQCIMLNNQSHTYITDDYIITHNTWFLTKLTESAHKYKFPVAYYSPEMQSAYLATRFDTWRAHFKNSDLVQGKYDEEYDAYIQNLSNDETPVFVIEDKDMMDGVTPRKLENFVKQNGIKLLIIDGLSYMEDDKKSSSDYDKYKHICADLFKLSKKYGCAVVVCGQANRETKNQVDGKGLPFPTLYNFEGSDHPGRIATQAFALRQVFETHVLDIRLEKARMANNQNPVFSYSWDINTGNMQYIPGENNGDTSAPTNSMPKLVADPVATGPIISTNEGPASDIPLVNDSDDDIEF